MDDYEDSLNTKHHRGQVDDCVILSCQVDESANLSQCRLILDRAWSCMRSHRSGSVLGSGANAVPDQDDSRHRLKISKVAITIINELMMLAPLLLWDSWKKCACSGLDGFCKARQALNHAGDH